MGLYLTIFDGDEEIDGVEVGLYDDFHAFREAVVLHIENGNAGSTCPTLIIHEDCDGEWTPTQAVTLLRELEQIETEFHNRPAVNLPDNWKKEVARTFGIEPKNLAECFFDIDGEPLIARLMVLCQKSIKANLPILFQ